MGNINRIVEISNHVCAQQWPILNEEENVLVKFGMRRV